MERDRLIEHYQKIYENQKRDFRNNNLRKTVLKEIKRKGAVLDIGCGTGHFTLNMLEDGMDVTAIDTLQEMVDFTTLTTKKYGSKVKTARMDAEDLSREFKPLTFDNILLIDVLEHIKDDEQLLQDLHSLLRENGELIIVVPAYQWCYGVRDKEIGHFRRYDKKDIVSKLIKNGFVIKKARYWNLISLLPYIVFEKILNKRPNEEFRYKEKQSLLYRIVCRMLDMWFMLIENRFSFGCGLSLLLVVKK
ncbi:MAG: class I SAM-dependent methyltransferase [Candidatus Margulisiibacteriota bacterium]